MNKLTIKFKNDKETILGAQFGIFGTTVEALGLAMDVIDTYLTAGVESVDGLKTSIMVNSDYFQIINISEDISDIEEMDGQSEYGVTVDLYNKKYIDNTVYIYDNKDELLKMVKSSGVGVSDHILDIIADLSDLKFCDMDKVYNTLINTEIKLFKYENKYFWTL